MKHINIRFILGAAIVCLPLSASAKTVAEDNDSTSKEKQVQVAFRKVNKSDILGGVSYIDYEELSKKNHNTYVLDNLQGYVGGYNGSLWASDSYLMIVDGVPRSDGSVIPDEVEQVTFLKGANAVVLYGSSAAKGALIITTKRGKVGNLSIKLNANTGLDVAKSYPKYLGSAEYMTLYNEALNNDGKAPLYSAEDIYNYGSGQNTYRYPNLDFYSSDYIGKIRNRSDVSAEISGGGTKARYYANVGFCHVNDVFKFGEARNNGTNRLNIRGNVDIDINSFITAFANANATFYDAKSANGSDNYWSQAATFRPNRISPLIPISYIDPSNLSAMGIINNSQNIIDGKYFLSGNSIEQTNVFADMYASGHGTYTARQFMFDAGVNIDLASLLKGLSFKTQFSVDYATGYSTTYNNSYATYTPIWSKINGVDMISSVTKVNEDKKSGVQNVSNSADTQTMLFSAQFDYNTSFNKVHNINATFVGAGYQNTIAGEYHRTSNLNLGLEVDYNYAQKYYAQIGAALIHSTKLAPGHRNALSPSLTLGWKMKNENFLKNVDAVDELTLSASLSTINTDLGIDDFYMYKASYDQSNGAWWGWKDGVSEHSTNSIRGGNDDLTFIKRKEFSVNLQTSLFNHLVDANVSFFTNVMDGGIITPSTLFPNYFFTYWPSASFISYMNYNKDRRTGLDFSVNVNKNIGAVDWSLGVNGTYYTTKVMKRDETHEYAYQNNVGRPLDALWGLVSDGFYQTDEEVANGPKSSLSTVQKGDIKYVDQNNDNKIDENDRVYLGKGGYYGKPFTMGVNLTAKWKDLTFFALLTGGFGAKAMKNNSYWYVYGDRKYSEVVRNRWTEENAANATYPRLTTGTSDNNFCPSTFWLYSTDAINLAKVQVSYDLPMKWFTDFFINGVSVYASGSNLLTISGNREILEMNVGNTPQTRFYNLGVNVKF